MHLTLGILRTSQAVLHALSFFWLDGFAVPAPAQVTQTVSPLIKSICENYAKDNTKLLCRKPRIIHTIYFSIPKVMGKVISHHIASTLCTPISILIHIPTNRFDTPITSPIHCAWHHHVGNFCGINGGRITLAHTWCGSCRC